MVEAGAEIGDRCKLGPRSTVKSGVTLGCDNALSEGAVLGGLPQLAAPTGPPGRLVVGDRNVFRENVTVHLAMTEQGVTRIGNDCLLMVASHVAHDCVVADRVILTNNVMLAGHVTVGERAFLGGGSAVHQHCRVGRIAMVGGMARIVQDVLPFVTIDGDTGAVVGLNRVGLRRSGMSREEMAEIKEAYRIIYRSGESFADRLMMLSERFQEGPAAELEPFLRDTSRGYARERRSPPGGTIRVIDDAMDAPVLEMTEQKSKRRAG
ncbi:Acyl-[acyl-carrier-protein]--UDP-N-acetylglucosamine O-acyltransferase [Planctomycetes bacterium K2D]|uniref:Acyl-[acyl-carrier-protein]--UDP-N-acetylglucosamine O-acyltransferase n=2 Tax=Botrimarina mediterranea TaxID=2528022 RepID=A0A518K3P5_9BACT|nr:Acyl-[acyl-carrier-protein]--UDP-N-acetylglucosamine O-acyltransferase [Botrimarina mediterranea]QDV76969.1 Acyl-[acyl-carrier-protein]--UDP-N-acetylglucosamine O-acyltransferase [Planctomycetes bacterium K2D]